MGTAEQNTTELFFTVRKNCYTNLRGVTETQQVLKKKNYFQKPVLHI